MSSRLEDNFSLASFLILLLTNTIRCRLHDFTPRHLVHNATFLQLFLLLELLDKFSDIFVEVTMSLLELLLVFFSLGLIECPHLIRNLENYAKSFS
jgi:hypothetical protein